MYIITIHDLETFYLNCYYKTIVDTLFIVFHVNVQIHYLQKSRALLMNMSRYVMINEVCNGM